MDEKLDYAWKNEYARYEHKTKVNFFFVTWEGLKEFMSHNETAWCIY